MKNRWFYGLTLALISAMFVITPAVMAEDMTADELVSEAKETVCEMPLAEARALLDKGEYLFVDCRTEKEFKMGHVPGAMNIPRGLLEFRVNSKIEDKNAKIIMYCKTGGRSCLATCTLCRMGYKNVSSLDRGWQGWEKAGYPID
ncbi:MAG: rhodanese-like domain-containing protein [Desulfobacterium sp.]|jgi:rhodanese-related sulfurtransferase|nr:rhodanese-like domain-containing protein [Desulfobacterium sp.]